MEVIPESIDIQKSNILEVVEESRVTLTRGPRGRFVIGNQESVGNKGGRPRKLTLVELVENPEKLDRIVKRFENGDTDALITILDLLEGKIK